MTVAASGASRTVCLMITKLTTGGAQETVLHSARGLIEEGWRVLIICGPDNRHDEGDLTTEAENLGATVLNLRSLHRRPSPMDLVALASMVVLLRRVKPHVVHTHSSKAGLLGRVAAFVARVPVIVHTVHGWSYNDQMRPIVRGVVIRGERWLSRITDTLVVVSAADEVHGRQVGITRTRYRLIRSGVDLQDFRGSVRRKHSPPCVGTVTRYAEQKDLRTFVRSAEMLLRSHPEVTYRMVGAGPLLEQLRLEVKERSLEDRISCDGPTRDVPGVMSKMSVFVLTSLWEGLPRTLLEATAAGLPIVSTDLPGVRELIEHEVSGLLVPTRSPEAVALAVARLLDDPDAAAAMVAAARARLDGFDVKTMVRETVLLYDELLATAATG